MAAKELSTGKKIGAALLGGGIGGTLAGGLVGFVIALLAPEKYGLKIIAGSMIIGAVGVGTLIYKTAEPA